MEEQAPKPKEILEIEAAYEIELDEGKYSLNEKNEIIHLSLNDFKIDSLQPLSNLQFLESLYINGCGVLDLSPLKKLQFLNDLFADNNQIRDLEGIAHIKKWDFLSLSNNKISHIRELAGTEVRSFYLDRNYIDDSQIEYICKIDSSGIFDLSDNHFTNLPKEFILRFDSIISEKYEYELGGQVESTIRKRLAIYNNPLVSPPMSVLDAGSKALMAYFDNKEKFGAKPLNEGRIILVGDGSAGKSSLAKRIIKNDFNDEEAQTNGINIGKYYLKKDNRDLTFNIWDFGGQEVQHAVHKFFFTTGCLYILVLDNRKEEEPEYWLQQIESLGGAAPVLVVFNKSDENLTERSNRKLLKEKYSNIVAFHNISCKTAYGIKDFIEQLNEQAAKLSTVNDEFPGNWFNIKKDIEQYTSNTSHYLVYNAYLQICKKHHVEDEHTQRLLLEYFSFIGAVTWFGDTYLNLMHVLNPAWITQGVYKIITGIKTEKLNGQIKVSDFKELLQPIQTTDYTYDTAHYGYILGLMKKFELCYTDNDNDLLIPSRFGKEPKIEYSEFKGERVRTYILQFTDYLPVAVVHQFIARNIGSAYDKNYWYEGIVLQDDMDGATLAMVQYDKEAKRIYIRIKGESKLGLWEKIRRDLKGICEKYARIVYSELVAVNHDDDNNVVEYIDLVNHLKAGRAKYFHPKLIREFEVATLIGQFETKEQTMQKFTNKEFFDHSEYREDSDKYNINVIIPVQNILENKNINTISNKVSVDVQIDLHIVQPQVDILREEANYLLREVANDNKELSQALVKVVEFADKALTVSSKEAIKEQGWKRTIGSVINTISKSSEFLKTVADGGEAAGKIMTALQQLAHYFSVNPPGSI